MINQSKTHQFLTYIINNYPNVSITGLMKLSYIIDLVSINKGQAQISTFRYIRYNYGPFDKAIYDYLKELSDNRIILEGSQIASSGDEFVVYNVNKRLKISFDKLGKKQKNIINEVLESLKGHGVKTLTELTYRTKPMQRIGATLENKKGLNQPLDLQST